MPMTHQEFAERFTRLLAKAPRGIVDQHCIVALQAGEAWEWTGMKVRPGHRATALAAGDCAGLHVLLRVGACGETLSGGWPTHSILAATHGELQVAARVPQSSMPAGRCISVAAIRWTRPPLECLRGVLDAGDVQGLLRCEIERLCEPARSRA
ncbi:MAG TPA: hypothetical protein VHA15_11730 [Burkholderiales bacterium]|jgi:hypothetical protein|nr:hypothetical protein [Burkholderiales bacterium]